MIFLRWGNLIDNLLNLYRMRFYAVSKLCKGLNLTKIHLSTYPCMYDGDPERQYCKQFSNLSETLIDKIRKWTVLLMAETLVSQLCSQFYDGIIVFCLDFFKKSCVIFSFNPKSLGAFLIMSCKYTLQEINADIQVTLIIVNTIATLKDADRHY